MSHLAYKYKTTHQCTIPIATHYEPTHHKHIPISIFQKNGSKPQVHMNFIKNTWTRNPNRFPDWPKQTQINKFIVNFTDSTWIRISSQKFVSKFTSQNRKTTKSQQNPRNSSASSLRTVTSSSTITKLSFHTREEEGFNRFIFSFQQQRTLTRGIRSLHEVFRRFSFIFASDWISGKLFPFNLTFVCVFSYILLSFWCVLSISKVSNKKRRRTHVKPQFRRR
jgi:hypothetical protein